ncbi:MAG: PTS sugar transporter subunit IIA [Elusimicrobia bacterium]|nr:PTS sugar transporter subunit IIA [Elusimicrobiota bacterium]
MVLPFFPDKKRQPAAALGKSERLSNKAGALVRPKSIAISNILSEDVVIQAPAGVGKDGLIELLVGRLCDRKAIGSPQTLLAKVLEREQGISTTLDTGLSLPHARVDSITEIVAALALVPQGIADPKAGDLTIRLMFLFFSSSRPDILPLHLQLLRGVASLFQPQIIAELAGAPDPAAALAIIRRVENP